MRLPEETGEVWLNMLNSMTMARAMAAQSIMFLGIWFKRSLHLPKKYTHRKPGRPLKAAAWRDCPHGIAAYCNICFPL
jgi:hypothetical protein